SQGRRRSRVPPRERRADGAATSRLPPGTSVTPSPDAGDPRAPRCVECGLPDVSQAGATGQDHAAAAADGRARLEGGCGMRRSLGVLSMVLALAGTSACGVRVLERWAGSQVARTAVPAPADALWERMPAELASLGL